MRILPINYWLYRLSKFRITENEKGFFLVKHNIWPTEEEKLKRGKWKICKEGKISSKKEKEKRENTVGDKNLLHV